MRGDESHRAGCKSLFYVILKLAGESKLCRVAKKYVGSVIINFHYSFLYCASFVSLHLSFKKDSNKGNYCFSLCALPFALYDFATFSTGRRAHSEMTTG